MSYDSNTQLDALLGKTLKERFTLRTVIGRGGMGAVFDGWDSQFDAPVAIKIILPSLLVHEIARHELMARFRREARNGFQLKHKNIVAVTDFGEDPEREMLFLVMERLEGRTLEAELRAEGRLTPQRAIRILTQACAAIDYAHQLEQIHRDIKPSNLMIIKHGREVDFVKVLDFGLARRLKDQDRLTRTDQIVGTAQYMAPEQLKPRTLLDPRCDIYMMGAVAYHVLSGQFPFEGTTFTEVSHAHDTQPLEPLSERVHGVPKTLSDVVERAMQKHPAERYPTMEDFREALERALQDSSRWTMPPAVIGDEPSGPRTPADHSQPGESSGTSTPPSGTEPASDGNRTAGQRGTLEMPSHARRRCLAIEHKAELATPYAGIVRASRPAVVAVERGVALLYEHAAVGASRISCHMIRSGLITTSRATLTEAPSIALAPAATAGKGCMFVVWADARAGAATQIYAGIWKLEHWAGVTEVPLGDALSNASSPAIASTPHGAIIAWHEVVHGTARIAVTLVDHACRTVSGPVRMQNGACPTLACSDDNAMLAWHEPSSVRNARAIRLTSIALPGGPILAPMRWPHSGMVAFPALAAARDGTFAMLWWSREPSPSAMVARVSRDGTLLGEPVRLGPAAPVPHRGCFVPVDDGYVASWTAPDTGVVTTWVPGDLAGPIAEPVVLDETRPASATLARLDDGVVAVWNAPGRAWAATTCAAQLSVVAS